MGWGGGGERSYKIRKGREADQKFQGEKEIKLQYFTPLADYYSVHLLPLQTIIQSIAFRVGSSDRAGVPKVLSGPRSQTSPSWKGKIKQN